MNEQFLNFLLKTVLPALMKYLQENPQIVEKLIAAMIAAIQKAIEDAQKTQ